MEAEDIKRKIGQLQLEIRIKKAQIKRIQSICPHKRFSYGTWESRPGQQYNNTKICDDCGKALEFVGNTKIS